MAGSEKMHCRRWHLQPSPLERNAKNVKEVVATKTLLPGTRVQLWPKDTFFKYGVVTAVDRHYVTFKITLVHPGEKHYREGDIVKIHKSMLYVHIC